MQGLCEAQMANGLCARCGTAPVYVTQGGYASGYCWDCRKWHQQTLQQIKREYPYEQTLAMQGGVCAICREEPAVDGRAFHYDHDHITGEFRGLLCHNCNLGLGSFRDSKQLLDLAAVYLEDPQRALHYMRGVVYPLGYWYGRIPSSWRRRKRKDYTYQRNYMYKHRYGRSRLDKTEVPCERLSF